MKNKQPKAFSDNMGHLKQYKKSRYIKARKRHFKRCYDLYFRGLADPVSLEDFLYTMEKLYRQVHIW